MTVPTRSPYCLTKYALEGFHDVLRYEMRSFGVQVGRVGGQQGQVSVLEPGNFIAGTNIFNEKFVNSQAELMWGAMGEEVKEAYGKDYFDQKVGRPRWRRNHTPPPSCPPPPPPAPRWGS